MRPTVYAPTAWHSSERSENGCDLLYTPVSELGLTGRDRHRVQLSTAQTVKSSRSIHPNALRNAGIAR
eukprot:scaffold61986_cov37-Phaeocystis_antarctica.AAC.1